MYEASEWLTVSPQAPPAAPCFAWHLEGAARSRWKDRVTYPMLEMMLKMMVTKTPRKNMMEKTEPRDVPSPSPPGVLPPASAMPMSTAAPCSRDQQHAMAPGASTAKSINEAPRRVSQMIDVAPVTEGLIMAMQLSMQCCPLRSVRTLSAPRFRCSAGFGNPRCAHGKPD